MGVYHNKVQSTRRGESTIPIYILHSGIAIDQGTQCLLHGRTTKYKDALRIVEIHYTQAHFLLYMVEVYHTSVKFA